ncbi:CHAP domain-containing protein [Actinosynnema sp. CS-041913]|uniref:CHAP domain-containing protein n=1 Tax=Actinosynnema sp. CS-041913 TaxID=3239917 RepID=UPI003D8D4CFE
MRTLLKTRAARFALAALAAVGVGLLGGAVGEQPVLVAAADTVDKSTRDKIVDIAQKELNGKHNKESGGYNCNYYSDQVARAKCQAWCADFARYVWDKAGVKTSGTNSLAASFRDYGKANKTWKNGPGLKNVKPGDVVTYRLNDGKYQNDHVGIVTKVNKKKGTITVISGNSGKKTDRVDKATEIDPTKTQVTGYASPVGKKGTKPKGNDKKPDKAKSDKAKSGSVEPKKPVKSADKPKKPVKSAEPQQEILTDGLVEAVPAGVPYSIAGPGA